MRSQQISQSNPFYSLHTVETANEMKLRTSPIVELDAQVDKTNGKLMLEIQRLYVDGSDGLFVCGFGPGSKAKKGGLVQLGDELLAVNDEEVEGGSLRDVIRALDHTDSAANPSVLLRLRRRNFSVYDDSNSGSQSQNRHVSRIHSPHAARELLSTTSRSYSSSRFIEEDSVNEPDTSHANEDMSYDASNNHSLYEDHYVELHYPSPDRSEESSYRSLRQEISCVTDSVYDSPSYESQQYEPNSNDSRQSSARYETTTYSDRTHDDSSSDSLGSQSLSIWDDTQQRWVSSGTSTGHSDRGSRAHSLQRNPHLISRSYIPGVDVGDSIESYDHPEYRSLDSVPGSIFENARVNDSEGGSASVRSSQTEEVVEVLEVYVPKTIGSLQLLIHEKGGGGGLYVRGFGANSKAARQGQVLIGDELLSINGMRVQGKSLDDVYRALHRGKYRNENFAIVVLRRVKRSSHRLENRGLSEENGQIASKGTDLSNRNNDNLSHVSEAVDEDLDGESNRSGRGIRKPASPCVTIISTPQTEGRVARGELIASHEDAIANMIRKPLLQSSAMRNVRFMDKKTVPDKDKNATVAQYSVNSEPGTGSSTALVSDSNTEQMDRNRISTLYSSDFNVKNAYRSVCRCIVIKAISNAEFRVITESIANSAISSALDRFDQIQDDACTDNDAQFHHTTIQGEKRYGDSQMSREDELYLSASTQSLEELSRRADQEMSVSSTDTTIESTYCCSGFIDTPSLEELNRKADHGMSASRTDSAIDSTHPRGGLGGTPSLEELSRRADQGKPVSRTDSAIDSTHPRGGLGGTPSLEELSRRADQGMPASRTDSAIDSTHLGGTPSLEELSRRADQGMPASRTDSAIDSTHLGGTPSLEELSRRADHGIPVSRTDSAIDSTHPRGDFGGTPSLEELSRRADQGIPVSRTDSTIDSTHPRGGLGGTPSLEELSRRADQGIPVSRTDSAIDSTHPRGGLGGTPSLEELSRRADQGMPVSRTDSATDSTHPRGGLGGTPSLEELSRRADHGIPASRTDSATDSTHPRGGLGGTPSLEELSRRADHGIPASRTDSATDSTHPRGGLGGTPSLEELSRRADHGIPASRTDSATDSTHPRGGLGGTPSLEELSRRADHGIPASRTDSATDSTHPRGGLGGTPSLEELSRRADHGIPASRTDSATDSTHPRGGLGGTPSLEELSRRADHGIPASRTDSATDSTHPRGGLGGTPSLEELSRRADHGIPASRTDSATDSTHPRGGLGGTPSLEELSRRADQRGGFTGTPYLEELSRKADHRVHVSKTDTAMNSPHHHSDFVGAPSLPELSRGADQRGGLGGTPSLEGMSRRVELGTPFPDRMRTSWRSCGYGFKESPRQLGSTCEKTGTVMFDCSPDVDMSVSLNGGDRVACDSDGILNPNLQKQTFNEDTEVNYSEGDFDMLFPDIESPATSALTPTGYSRILTKCGRGTRKIESAEVFPDVQLHRKSDTPTSGTGVKLIRHMDSGLGALFPEMDTRTDSELMFSRTAPASSVCNDLRRKFDSSTDNLIVPPPLVAPSYRGRRIFGNPANISPVQAVVRDSRLDDLAQSALTHNMSGTFRLNSAPRPVKNSTIVRCDKHDVSHETSIAKSKNVNSSAKMDSEPERSDSLSERDTDAPVNTKDKIDCTKTTPEPLLNGILASEPYVTTPESRIPPMELPVRPEKEEIDVAVKSPAVNRQEYTTDTKESFVNIACMSLQDRRFPISDINEANDEVARALSKLSSLSFSDRIEFCLICSAMSSKFCSQVISAALKTVSRKGSHEVVRNRIALSTCEGAIVSAATFLCGLHRNPRQVRQKLTARYVGHLIQSGVAKVIDQSCFVGRVRSAQVACRKNTILSSYDAACTMARRVVYSALHFSLDSAVVLCATLYRRKVHCSVATSYALALSSLYTSVALTAVTKEISSRIHACHLLTTPTAVGEVNTDIVRQETLTAVREVDTNRNSLLVENGSATALVSYESSYDGNVDKSFFSKPASSQDQSKEHTLSTAEAIIPDRNDVGTDLDEVVRNFSSSIGLPSPVMRIQDSLVSKEYGDLRRVSFREDLDDTVYEDISFIENLAADFNGFMQQQKLINSSLFESTFDSADRGSSVRNESVGLSPMLSKLYTDSEFLRIIEESTHQSELDHAMEVPMNSDNVGMLTGSCSENFLLVGKPCSASNMRMRRNARHSSGNARSHVKVIREMKRRHVMFETLVPKTNNSLMVQFMQSPSRKVNRFIISDIDVSSNVAKQNILRVGDEILEVNGVKVEGLFCEDILELIVRDRDSFVLLKVLRRRGERSPSKLHRSLTKSSTFYEDII